MSDEVFGDMISLYSRADAIRDGVLIEADPKICKEAGIKWSVAISDHLWRYIEPDNLEDMPGQSVTGRLWDLLWMFTLSTKRTTGPTDRLTFRVIFQMKTGRTPTRQETITVIAVCGPGDDNEPVITLMLPGDE
jgi:hypothetical protein